MYWDILLYPCRWIIYAMCTKKFTASDVGTIVPNFQVNWIISVLWLLLHHTQTAKNTNTFSSIGCNVLRFFCVSLLFGRYTQRAGLCTHAIWVMHIIFYRKHTLNNWVLYIILIKFNVRQQCQNILFFCVPLYTRSFRSMHSFFKQTVVQKIQVTHINFIKFYVQQSRQNLF